MKAYAAIFRLRFINALQYRAAMLAGMVTQLAWGFMAVLAFTAFYRANPSVFPMKLSQTVSYIWMQQAFLILFMVVVFSDGDIDSTIESGSIAYELVRPLDIYGRWFCQACASRVAMTVMRLPMMIIAFIMPEPYRMSMPPDVTQLALFLPSMALALGVTVAFTMLMYISMFYTVSVRGVRGIVNALATFLAGSIIPLPFFPAPVRAVVELLPFAAMQNMPLRIYSGNISGADALKGIVFQIFWLIVLLLIGRFSMRRALKKVIVQGG